MRWDSRENEKKIYLMKLDGGKCIHNDVFKEKALKG
jgi:hypothetical protein